MAKRKVYCVVEGCFDERKYVASGLCAACYAGMYYWKGRNPTDIVKRKQQIARLASRMDYMLPKVKAMRGRRRRAG